MMIIKEKLENFGFCDWHGTGIAISTVGHFYTRTHVEALKCKTWHRERHVYYTVYHGTAHN